MSKTPFVQSPVHAGIVQGYRNPSYIADQVMPAIAVPSRTFAWDFRSVKNLMVAPPNEVGRAGRTPRLEFNAEQRTSSIKDYGYDLPVPRYDQEVAEDQRRSNDGLTNPLDYAAMAGAEVLRLRREIRVAESVADNANHNTVETLAGSDLWSDPSSDPKTQIQELKEAMLQEANVMVLNNVSARYLRNHPVIVESIKGSGATQGQATLAEVADLLELDAILVGVSRQVLSNVNDFEADAASSRRVWGNFAALLHVNAMVRSTTNSPFLSWGFTGKYRNDVAMTRFEADMGLSGGDILRVGEKCREVVSSPICGTLIQNVYAAEADLAVGDTAASISGSSADYTGV